MKSSYHSNTNASKYYILTQPTKLSDLTLDDLEDDDDFAWRDKARKLQTRRWRKLKNQLA